MTSDISQNAALLQDLNRFITDYFNLEEIRMLCFQLGVNYENLPGETRTRKARELIIHLGQPGENGRCQARYEALLVALKDKRSAFYPNLFEKLALDDPIDPADLPKPELARHYCEGCAEYMRMTRPLHEKALSRIGLENRVSTLVIVLILSAFALASYLLWRQIRPDQMSGDFNIAVAPFAVTGAEPEIGVDVANSIFGRLQANFGEDMLPIVAVWGPNEPLLHPVPLVAGATDDAQDDAAARLAAEINADIVVYGSIVQENGGWTVTPKFYVSPNNFENASEILGPYDLGQEFALLEGGRRALRITAGEELTPRTEFLTQVAVGLTYYSIANYDRAAETFTATLNAVGDKDQIDDASTRLVYLLLGNAALKKSGQEVAAINRGDVASVADAESRIALLLDQAEQYFSQSAAVDPDYARAYVGLGDIAYQKSFQCQADTCDVMTLLGEAVSYYEQALAAKISPKTAVIDAKVNFSLGQVYYRQSTLDGGASIGEAIDHFQAVIDDYQGGESPRARDIAAEAQARLGLIYCYQGRFADAIDRYNNAIALYADDPAQTANRLLPRDVRAQRSDLFEFRVTMLENDENPNCASVP